MTRIDGARVHRPRSMTRIDGARVHRPRSMRLEVSGQMSGRARLSIKAGPFKLRQYGRRGMQAGA